MYDEWLSTEAEMMVRANFNREIEFSGFVTQRFQQQVKKELLISFIVLKA